MCKSRKHSDSGLRALYFSYNVGMTVCSWFPVHSLIVLAGASDSCTANLQSQLGFAIIRPGTLTANLLETIITHAFHACLLHQSRLHTRWIVDRKDLQFLSAIFTTMRQAKRIPHWGRCCSCYDSYCCLCCSYMRTDM